MRQSCQSSCKAVRDPYGCNSPTSGGIRQIVISEALLNRAKRFTIDFSIWIDEVIQRLSPLLRSQDQIATDGELDAARFARPERDALEALELAHRTRGAARPSNAR